MPFQEGLFFILAGLAILSALMVILGNNPVRCVLSLVVTFIASSGLWLLAHAEFLALILVLVYVGAVMTLFLFVVMMLNVEKIGQRVRYWPFGLAIAAFLVFLVLLAIKPENFGSMQDVDTINSLYNTQSLGLVLYTIYAYPLEAAAILLLTAIVSAIVLAHRPPRNSRVQQLPEQLSVRKSDRLRVVQISSQKGTS